MYNEAKKLIDKCEGEKMCDVQVKKSMARGERREAADGRERMEKVDAEERKSKVKWEVSGRRGREGGKETRKMAMDISIDTVLTYTHTRPLFYRGDSERLRDRGGGRGAAGGRREEG